MRSTLTIVDSNELLHDIITRHPNLTIGQLYGITNFFKNYWFDDVQWITHHPKFYVVGEYSKGFYAGITKDLKFVDGIRTGDFFDDM